LEGGKIAPLQKKGVGLRTAVTGGEVAPERGRYRAGREGLTTEATQKKTREMRGGWPPEGLKHGGKRKSEQKKGGEEKKVGRPRAH